MTYRVAVLTEHLFVPSKIANRTASSFNPLSLFRTVTQALNLQKSIFLEYENSGRILQDQVLFAVFYGISERAWGIFERFAST